MTIQGFDIGAIAREALAAQAQNHEIETMTADQLRERVRLMKEWYARVDGVVIAWENTYEAARRAVSVAPTPRHGRSAASMVDISVQNLEPLRQVRTDAYAEVEALERRIRALESSGCPACLQLLVGRCDRCGRVIQTAAVGS